MFLYWTHFIIGTCLELVGMSAALNESAGLPWCTQNPWGQACTTSMLGDGAALESDPELCWLPAPVEDSSFDAYWCQPVSVNGLDVTTPCESDFVTRETAPCVFRQEFARLDCPEWAADPNGMFGQLCTPEVVTCP